MIVLKRFFFVCKSVSSYAVFTSCILSPIISAGRLVVVEAVEAVTVLWLLQSLRIFERPLMYGMTAGVDGVLRKHKLKLR